MSNHLTHHIKYSVIKTVILRGANHQLMLLGAATLVLLFFAWTYID